MTTDADRQLLEAAFEGNAEAVEEALRNKAIVDARDEFGDTALNRAAERGHDEIVKRLLDAGADVENNGGADKTPLMNAALAGHTETVLLLLRKGARVSRDLLSSMQLKIDILAENAESGMVRPDAAGSWTRFRNFLVLAQLTRDLPEIIQGLSAGALEDRRDALGRMAAAANRGIDLSAAAAQLEALTADPDGECRGTASAALAGHYRWRKDWGRLGNLLASGDSGIATAAIPSVVSAAQDGMDISSLLPILTNLLSHPALSLRHDAAIALGYAATAGTDVSATIPQLTALLSDARPEARKMAAWALYRIAQYVGGISAAVPALQSLQDDEDEGVREMASEALRMSTAQSS